MSEEKVRDLIIIGSGPAGFTAAIYAARADLKPFMIEGMVAGGAPGGQLMLTTDVENFPGFSEGILGPDLMTKMREQAKRFGAEMVQQDVVEVDFSSKPFKLKTSDDKEHKANAVIISTGASAKWLGLESETALRGRGVSSCATCDGAFFRDKKVAIVGGGDSAMEEANFLTKFATEVYAIVRGDKEDMKASKIMVERAMNNPKIKFIFNSEIVEIKGVDDGKVTGIVLKNNKDNSTADLDLGGVFIAIGHKPNTAIVKDKLELDKIGYIKVENGSTKTSVEGVFAAGDVVDHKYRQAITAAGTGCMAALDAQWYLAEQS